MSHFVDDNPAAMSLGVKWPERIDGKRAGGKGGTGAEELHIDSVGSTLVSGINFYKRPPLIKAMYAYAIDHSPVSIAGGAISAKSLLGTGMDPRRVDMFICCYRISDVLKRASLLRR